MTLDAFRLLPSVAQLSWAVEYGTYLAQRWEGIPVNLYHVPDKGRGFFVEVGVALEEQPLVLRSFVSALSLEDYAHYVELPEEWA